MYDKTEDRVPRENRPVPEERQDSQETLSELRAVVRQNWESLPDDMKTALNTADNMLWSVSWQI